MWRTIGKPLTEKNFWKIQEEIFFFTRIDNINLPKTTLANTLACLPISNSLSFVPKNPITSRRLGHKGSWTLQTLRVNHDWSTSQHSNSTPLYSDWPKWVNESEEKSAKSSGKRNTGKGHFLPNTVIWGHDSWSFCNHHVLQN